VGSTPSVDTMSICPLCNRDVPHMSDHHLTPRSRGGKETIPICLDCHKSVHAFFTNKELEGRYNTVEELLGDEKFSQHVKWLGKQDANRRYRTVRVSEKKHRGRSG
jgi:5-methylcytosine-specific restriction enzyme A